MGHLAGLADADSYDPKYAKWRYDDLPILPEHWQMVMGKEMCIRDRYICIFIVIYGRMIEIYLVTSVAPVPMAAMMGKELSLIHI